jgi:dienelactone hydrolase
MKSLLLFAILSLTSPVLANVAEKTIEYIDGETVLEGFLYHNETDKNPKPGVIVVHEWMGLDEYAKKRARELAEQGYV